MSPPQPDTCNSKVFSREPLNHRGTEITLLLARNIGYPIILVSLMPWYISAVFLVIHMALFGVYMGASFAPNHKGMPQIAAGIKVDFLRRQVLTSRNIRGGLFMDHFMGGLNYLNRVGLAARDPFDCPPAQVLGRA